MIEHKEVLSSLRKALAHIDDPTYLEGLPYLEKIEVGVSNSSLSRGQMIQRTLRVAIDRLAPSAGTNALDALTYEALYQYTLSRRNMSGIAMRLGMSERQAYRLLNRAIDALADELLRSHTNDDTETALDDSSTGMLEDHVRRELERLVAEDVQRVDMIQLLHQVRADVAPLAQDLGIALEMHLGNEQLYVIANRVLLRQALLNLVSYVISCTTPGLPVRITLQQEYGNAQILLTYGGQAPGSGCDPQGPLSIAERILEMVDIAHTQHTTAQDLQEIALRLPVVYNTTVLIVDDNEDLIALFRRYLRDQPFRVYGAASYDQARQAIIKHQPDAVILDIMLPRRDGWELLRTLRDSDLLPQPKVIVCSIINDPELSTSLGADAFLNKPVSKRQLIETLYSVRSTLT
jgi:CheY-like chemotaxis protein